MCFLDSLEHSEAVGWNTEGLGIDDELTSEEMAVADLLENHVFPPPYVAAGGSATMMVPYISSEVSMELEDYLKRSKAVQRAFSLLVTELFLSSTTMNRSLSRQSNVLSKGQNVGRFPSRAHL